MATMTPPQVRRNSSYLDIVDHLRAKIRTGALTPGDRLPSFAELQVEFGAATNTVNRAFINLEQEGLICREKRRGVFVAEPVSQPLKGIVGLLGFDYATRHSPYWFKLLEGIQDAAHSCESEVLLLQQGRPVRWEKIDGVLLHGQPNEFGGVNLPPGMPAVGLMCEWPGLAVVAVDDTAAVRTATAQLLQLGHRRIAYMGFLETQIMERRLDGYRQALARAGILPDASWMRDIEFMGDDMRTCGAYNMRRWLAAGFAATGCTAIHTQNDETAQGVLDALQEAGYEVPGQISVVGYDGVLKGRTGGMHLASVNLPLREIGQIAMTTLFKEMSGEVVPAAAILLPGTFVANESVSGPGVTSSRGSISPIGF